MSIGTQLPCIRHWEKSGIFLLTLPSCPLALAYEMNAGRIPCARCCMRLYSVIEVKCKCMFICVVVRLYAATLMLFACHLQLVFSPLLCVWRILFYWRNRSPFIAHHFIILSLTHLLLTTTPHHHIATSPHRRIVNAHSANMFYNNCFSLIFAARCLICIHSFAFHQLTSRL